MLVSVSLGHVILPYTLIVAGTGLAEFFSLIDNSFILFYFSVVWHFHFEETGVERSVELISMEFLVSLFIPFMINQKLQTADKLFNFEV